MGLRGEAWLAVKISELLFDSNLFSITNKDAGLMVKVRLGV